MSEKDLEQFKHQFGKLTEMEGTPVDTQMKADIVWAKQIVNWHDLTRKLWARAILDVKRMAASTDAQLESAESAEAIHP